MGVIGTFGTLPFVCSSAFVLTFDGLSRELSVRWAQHDVIGAKPVMEYIGPDLASISMTIRFDSTLGLAPLLGLKKLKGMLEDGTARALIIGGEYFGRFIMESVSEERRHHTGFGVCQVAEAKISLKECGGTSLWHELQSLL
ncbi:phage tail protein [uncultured Mailhella sp.]|uniref:phage tail protein n=1 Tax=uncultured Mailhella sp. TaxID=1981031 RepID=UPI0025DF41C5|nr:phage tail protein [uncultured Mailhella sp.]